MPGCTQSGSSGGTWEALDALARDGQVGVFLLMNIRKIKSSHYVSMWAVGFSRLCRYIQGVITIKQFIDGPEE